MTRPRAVLFDIGGPIDAETEHERRMDRAIRAAVTDAGIAVSDAAYMRACARAVDSHAPNAYHAIVWALLDGSADRAARVWDRVVAMAGARTELELRPGIAELLGELHGHGIGLGFAANQPASVVPMLDAAGIARFFTSCDVSASTGLRKPDPRLFLQVCAALDVAPGQCIMVGDRIDNDIAPARALGMATIRFRAGRHAEQQPRSWLDLPLAEVTDVAGLAAALRHMLQIA